MKRFILASLLITFISSTAIASDIFKHSTTMPYDEAYKKVYSALEDNRFYVVEEINIGASLSRFKDSWDDYNQNQLEAIKVMIICNGWYANQVSNKDPDMLALCPMKVTMTHKEGQTSALFARPSTFAEKSPARALILEAEQTVIQSIESALK